MFFKKKKMEGEWAVEKMLVEIDNNLAVAQDNIDAIHEALASGNTKWDLQLDSEDELSHQLEACT